MTSRAGRLIALVLSVTISVSGCGIAGGNVDATPPAPGTAAAPKSTAMHDAGDRPTAETTEESGVEPESTPGVVDVAGAVLKGATLGFLILLLTAPLLLLGP